MPVIQPRNPAFAARVKAIFERAKLVAKATVTLALVAETVAE